jgi:hypothetical protein
MTPKYINKSFQEKTACCVAHYINRDKDMEATRDYNVKIFISGYYEDENDEDNGFEFIEDDDIDYVNLVITTGEIPEWIKGGFKLQYVDVEDVY